MSEQEVTELKIEIHNALKQVYFKGFHHGFTAALTGSVIYYFFI